MNVSLLNLFFKVFTKSKLYNELCCHFQKYISLSAPQGRIHTVLLVQCQPLSLYKTKIHFYKHVCIYICVIANRILLT